jgi:hypothetical protein
VYVQRDIEARLHNQCYRENARSITYSVCVYVALVIQHASDNFCAVLYCHLWPVRLYHIFLQYLIHVTIFGEKNIQRKMCFDFL